MITPRPGWIRPPGQSLTEQAAPSPRPSRRIGIASIRRSSARAPCRPCREEPREHPDGTPMTSPWRCRSCPPRARRAPRRSRATSRPAPSWSTPNGWWMLGPSGLPKESVSDSGSGRTDPAGRVSPPSGAAIATTSRARSRRATPAPGDRGESCCQKSASGERAASRSRLSRLQRACRPGRSPRRRRSIAAHLAHARVACRRIAATGFGNRCAGAQPLPAARPEVARSVRAHAQACGSDSIV